MGFDKEEGIKSGIKRSFKWSTITEILARLISPVLNAVLAHILIPEEFAPLTAVNMVLTFSEIFVESGFRKYLIQHKFADEEDYNNHFSTAFWTNLLFSVFVMSCIMGFSKPIASFLKNDKLWKCLMVSSVIVPLYATSGLYNSKLQKQLQFKKLFYVRIVTSLIPLFVTIPLALAGMGYWSLIIGNVAMAFAQTVVLFFVGKNKLLFHFSKTELASMFRAAIWTILDGLVIWATSWVELFLIGRYMSDYYLGLYNNSISIVNNLSGIITASAVPVLYVGLSKLKDDDEQFSDLFNKTQRIIMLFFIPMGLGCFLYSNIIVSLLLGSKWMEASRIIGVVAITSFLRTVYIGICSDAYRAKGHFYIPFVFQMVDLLILIPVCYLASQRGFWMLVYVRALIRLDLIVPEAIVLKAVLKINLKDQLKKSIPIYICALSMFVICYSFNFFFKDSLIMTLGIPLGIVSYFSLLFCFPSARKSFLESSIGKKLMRKQSEEKESQ